MSSAGIGIWVTISKPYVREDGKLVVEFNVCGHKFEREIEGGKENTEWRLTDPKKENGI